MISDEKLVALYKNLVNCHAKASRNGNSNGTDAALLSHQAAIVGTAIDLGSGDVVCSLDHHALLPLSESNAIQVLLLESAPNGRVRPPKSPSNGTFPSRLTHTAIGIALANKTAKNGAVAVLYSAAIDSDSLGDALDIAATHGLPMIFVQQVNGSALRDITATSTATGTTKKKANRDTPWFPSITVDTNDVVAVYRVANEAITRARLGGGPTHIECRPFQLPGASKNGNGRHTHEAVHNMEHYLRTKGLFDPAVMSVSSKTRKS